MEASTLVKKRGEEEGTSVNQDAGSWSILEPGICDMILEKLPSLERHRLRVVCKDWNCSALKRVERKPYSVTILRKPISAQYLCGLVVYDHVVSNSNKSLSFEPLPFKLYDSSLAPFAVEGLIFTNQPWPMYIDDYPSYDYLDDVTKKQWCVYNIHNRTKHRLPPAPGCGSESRKRYFCGMMVDTSIKPYPFKLVVSYSTGEVSQIYDSGTRSWSSHPNPNPHSNSSLLLAYCNIQWYFCMCHKGCMYMCTKKAVDGVLVYSMEEDQWSKLSGSPFRGEKRPFLGAWDDRIFAIVHDAGAKSVTVWELIDATQQEWAEYACCSKAQYEHLKKQCKFVRDCQCEIASVFSEEYVLMYTLHVGRLHALTVLLNLKTRDWEPVASIPNMIDKTRLCLTL